MTAQQRGEASDQRGEQGPVGPVQAGRRVGSAEYRDLVRGAAHRAGRPDGCLKAGVVANVVVPTADYVRFATHYGFGPDSCHGNDPESKGLQSTWSATPSGT